MVMTNEEFFRKVVEEMVNTERKYIEDLLMMQVRLFLIISFGLFIGFSI